MADRLISREEAIQIAKNRNRQLNCYQEYEDGYYFYYEDGNEYDGGWQCGFVVLKSGNGIVMPYTYFLDSSYKCKKIGEPCLYD